MQLKMETQLLYGNGIYNANITLNKNLTIKSADDADNVVITGEKASSILEL